MSSPTKEALIEAGERLGVPLVALSYVILFAVYVRETTEKLGWRTISFIACAVCVVWCFYVWIARRPNDLDPSLSVRRFDRAPRIGATVAAILSSLPLLYVALVRYPPPAVPFMVVSITNITTSPIAISEYGEFFLSEVETPLMDRAVKAGLIKWQSAEQPDTFTIVPNTTHVYAGFFQNEHALVPLLSRGDLKLSVMISTQDGRSVTMHELPFSSEGYAKTLFQVSLK